MPKIKNCIKCGEEKILSEFHKHKQMEDGHLNKCKDCVCEYVKKHYRENPEYYQKYEKARNQEPERKNLRYGYQIKHRKNNPDKYRARTAIGNALRDGRIERDSCIHCQNPETQAHHHDYSKPLDVVWVCFDCHRKHHHGQLRH